MDEWTGCDECTVARATVHIYLPSGGELTLCSHHYNGHADALRAAHATIIQNYQENPT